MKLDENPQVLLAGASLLFQKQIPFTDSEIAGEDVQHNLVILKKSQFSLNGLGIAAPQIGWAARAMTMGVNSDNKNRYPNVSDIEFEFWINPEICSFSEETCWAWEGCLSVPGIRGWVERPTSIIATGLDEYGQQKKRQLEGFAARVFMHEADHLDGILFPMHIRDTKLLVPLESFKTQKSWQQDWPTPGARSTLPGQTSEKR